MPNEPASEAQRRAMHAAASGKSNIGIPTSVGQKMTKEWGEAHDDAEKEASASVIKKRTPEDRESAMAAKKAEKENESLEDALDNSVNAVRSLLGRMDAYVSRRMDDRRVIGGVNSPTTASEIRADLASAGKIENPSREASIAE